MKTTIFSACIFAATVMGSVAANAATLNNVTCSISGNAPTALFTVNDAVDAVCINGSGTQDSEAMVNSFNAFGYNDWNLADKNDDNSSGDGVIGFSTDAVNDVQSGSFTIGALPSNITDLMVTLKTGGNAALFQMTLGDLTSNWSIVSKDLSHSSLFYRTGTVPPPSPVPLPASGLLLLGAIGALALRRRKS